MMGTEWGWTISDEDTILEVFKYFVSPDMILEAFTMQSNLDGLEDGTLLQEEEEIQNEDMETESFCTTIWN